MKEFYLSKQEAFDAIAERRAKAEERKHQTTMRELDQLNALENLTVRQAATLVSVSEKVIYAACEPTAKSFLKHTRLGQGRGTIRIKRSDLEDFMQQNQVRVAKDYLSD